MSNLNSRWGPAESKYKGLRNQGSTCYLNSVLQVLFMTGEFREAVLSSETSHTSYIDAQLKDLFLQLETGSPTTEYIIHRLGIEDVWEQQDAAEYFEKMLSLASPEASQVFHGRLIHRTSCECGDSTDEHNSFWSLNLPINNASTGVYKVEEGLKGFLSQSKLAGDNQVYCDECEAKADSTTECEVELYPKVLVLLLKRFEFSYYEMNYVKNDCPVDVPLNIEAPKGVSYELYATVDHVGSLRGGHYTATIQSPDDGGSWFYFNDSVVTPKNNFNPEKSQDGYLLFYRKTPMSESPQEDHCRSSVDPAESMTNQNNADDGNADNYSEDNSNTSPSSPHVRLCREGLAGVGVTGLGEVRVGSREPCDHAVQPEASVTGPMVRYPEGGVNKKKRKRTGQRESTGLLKVCEEGKTEDDAIEREQRIVIDNLNGAKCKQGPGKRVVVAGRGEVMGRGDVGVGDTPPLKMGGKRMKIVAVPTNEIESHEPGDHAVQSEASGTRPMVRNLEGGDNERRRRRTGQRESTDLLKKQGKTEGNVMERKHRKVIDNLIRSFRRMYLSYRQSHTKSKRGPEKRVGVAGRGEVMGRGEVRVGDTPPLEVGDERMNIVAGPTNKIESHEPGDHAVQSEASGTGPMVRYLEGGVNKRKRRGRGQRESTGLLKEEGETEDNIMERKHRKVIDNPNHHTSLSRKDLSSRQSHTKYKQGPGKRVGVAGRGEVRMGDTPPLKMGGKRMKAVAVQINKIESGEPGDHAVQPEARGTGPMVRYLEGGVNERKRRTGQRESTGFLEVCEEGKTEGNVIERKHRKVIDNLNRSLRRMFLSCWPSRPKHKRGPGKRVGVAGCGEVMGRHDVRVGDTPPLEVGGKHMNIVVGPTNEIESHEPGDHAVQSEASGTGPMVRYLEGSVNERKRRRRRGQRESTGLLEVCEEGKTEGKVMERKHRKVIDNLNSSFFGRMFLSCWPIRPKHKRGPEKRVGVSFSQYV